MSDAPHSPDGHATSLEGNDPRFLAFMQNSPAVAWIKDDKFQYRYINHAFEVLFNRTTAEIIGKEDYDLMPKENADQTRANDASVLASDEATEIIEAVPGADGVVKHWLVKKFPFGGEKGETWTGGMAFDITARIEAEESLRQSDKRFRAFMDNTRTIAWVKDDQLKIQFINHAYEEVFNCSRASTIGKTSHDILPAEFANRTHAKDLQVLKSGEPTELVEEIPTFDGRLRHWLVSKFPFPGPDGKTWLGGAAVEITERAVTEQRLQDSQALYASLVATIPMNVFRKDLEGRITFMSPQYCEELGLTSEEIIGKTDFDLFPKELAEKYREDDRRVIEAEETIELVEEYKSAVDSRSFVQTLKTPVHDASGKVIGMQGVFWDITEKKLAEEELRKAHQRQDLHIRQTPLGVIEWDPDFRVADWNPSAERIFGYTRSEAIGQHASFIIPESARKQVNEIWTNLFKKSGGLRSTNENLHKSGRIIQCDWHNTPLIQANGKVIGVTALVTDITDLTEAEAERKRMEEKLQETQKLESLGVLAGGIAHDFNNLLTGVLGNASLARMQLPPDSSILRYIDQIEQASTRAADLCSQMLAYSGKGRFVIEHIDLNLLLHDTTHLLELSVSKRAALKFNHTPNLPPIMADATQLRQIVMNLVINASEAIGDKNGVITLATRLQQVDRDYLEFAQHGEELQPGNYVILEVSDNGCGMDLMTQAKIFDPFFTTKFTGRGLGLAAVLGIVRGHSGTLKVYSEPGEGTTFKLLLPCAEGSATTAELDGADKPQIAYDGRVLIVDDEETVRIVAGEMLTAFGFEVTTANDGVEGLKRFRELSDPIRLVLLDLTMPNMDGEETFREIRRINQDARVLLMSGFNEQEAINRFAGKGLAGFIQKPFKADSLRAKIQEALSSSPD
jgi:PAS domain S-box-containing protein